MKAAFTLFLSLVVLTACNKSEDPTSRGNLDKLGIVGTWEIFGLTINGASELSIRCCDFVEFSEDANLKDLNGQYRSYGLGVESAGILSLDTINNTITFGKDEQSLKVYGFEIRGEYLDLIYSDGGNNLIETYIRRY